MSDEAEYGLEMPMWIDTEGYTDRDREMFVCGAEFHQVYQTLKQSPEGLRKPIHTENESRVRMMLAKLGRRYEIRQTGTEGWSDLLVFGGDQ